MDHWAFQYCDVSLLSIVNPIILNSDSLFALKIIFVYLNKPFSKAVQQIYNYMYKRFKIFMIHFLCTTVIRNFYLHFILDFLFK